ncbi:MAG: tetratricopeptide repeat protein, partial [Chloroflexota bacterium]
NVDNYGIVLARDTENFAPLMVRAAAYAYGGEFDSAIEEYEAALDAAPDFAPIYAALGDIYYELEDFDEALAYYETYIELADDDAREDVVERYEELEE